MSGKLRKWITIVCAVVFAGSVLGLCWYFFQQYRENQVDSSVAGLISATSAHTTAGGPHTRKKKKKKRTTKKKK